MDEDLWLIRLISFGSFILHCFERNDLFHSISAGMLNVT